MKICVIGDPHGNLELVKKFPLKGTDLILLTGDLGSANLLRKMAFENVELKRKGFPEKEYSPSQEKKAFMEAYSSTLSLVKYLIKFAPVYTIFGNVESSNSETRKKSKQIGLKLPFIYDALNELSGVKVINSRVVNFHGTRIGGLEYFLDSSWVNEFHPNDFEDKIKLASKQSKKTKKVLSHFKKLDILLCHQPPYGVLDKVGFSGAPKSWLGKHAGSKVILDYIKKNNPPYVFCGHIHEEKGKEFIGSSQVFNLGSCGYQIIDL